jgi:hypothetical protein
MKSKFSALYIAALAAFAYVYSTACAAVELPYQYFALTWTPPTNNEDGSPLSDLVGYYIYSGTSPDSMVPAFFTNADNPRITLAYPLVGTYYFAISAVNVSGTESALTPPVSNVMP